MKVLAQLSVFCFWVTHAQACDEYKSRDACAGNRKFKKA